MLENSTPHQVLSPEILIVGAGVAGATLAISLHQKGHDVLLVDRLTQPLKIFKGEFIQPAALRALDKIGAAKKINTGNFIRELRFRDIGKSGEVLSDILMAYPKGLAARSSDHQNILNALFDRATEVLGDKFWRGVDLAPLNPSPLHFRSHPRLSVKRKGADSSLPLHFGQNLILEPKWVVGCDGRTSSVRKWSGGLTANPKEEVTTGSGAEWIIGFEVETEAKLAHRYEVFRSYTQGTTSLFSLGDSKQRLYYSLPIDPDPTQNPVRLAPKLVSDVWVEMEKNGFEKKPADLGAARAYCAGTAWYGSPAKGRVLLAGDALCVTTPFGGQGMTAACENAMHLAEKFPWSQSDPATLARARTLYTETAQDTYHRINLMNFGLYQLFFNRSAVVKLPTQHIMQTWKENPELSARVMRLFAGVDNDIPSKTELLELWGVHPMQQLRRFMPESIPETLSTVSNYIPNSITNRLPGFVKNFWQPTV